MSDEQNMRDLELISFLTSSSHISVRTTTARTEYDLDSTADSREQTQKASFVRSPRNFESRCLRAIRAYSWSWALARQLNVSGGLNVGRFHPK